MSVADDERALRALHARYAGPLYGYARQALRDDGAAEELVQDVLMRAWQHADALDRPDELGPWLYTVARNLVIDRHRRARSRPSIGGNVTTLDSYRHAGDDEAEDVTELLARSELIDALRRLSPAQREAIVEVFYRNATVATCATALGIAEGTVKSRLYYGLRALRDMFDQMGTAR